MNQLSREEKQRVTQLKITAKKYEFAKVRSALRILLGRYLSITPSGVVLASNSHGKPYIKGQNISFNVSHSYGKALIGMTRSAVLGLDIEKIRDKIDWLGLSRRYFSKKESQELKNAEPESVKKLFFTCWTRKEAFVKALGRGIGYGLGNFDVAFLDKDVPAVRNTRWDKQEADRWAITPVSVNIGYVAAICYEKKKIEKINHLRWCDLIATN